MEQRELKDNYSAKYVKNREVDVELGMSFVQILNCSPHDSLEKKQEMVGVLRI